VKPAVYILLVALILAMLTVLAADRSPPSTAGRYSLTAATVQTFGATTNSIFTVSSPELFRIDTTTGQTWRLFILNDGSNTFCRWTPIPNP
jgi:DNA-binding IclR family transcriptional regulator